MKQPRYKIYKQVGIHDLVPFKANVKLFRHLLVSKYTFLYFFHREFVNRKLNKLRLNLKRYLHPFLSPITKQLFSDYKNESSKFEQKRIVNTFDTEKANVTKLKYDYTQFTRFRLSSNKPRHKFKPSRYFKKRLTKLPKKNRNTNNELLNAYFALFPNSDYTPSTLNYSYNKSSFLDFFLIVQKLYLKLSFVNLEQTLSKFKSIRSSSEIAKISRNSCFKLLKGINSIHKVLKLFTRYTHFSICYSLPLFFRLKKILASLCLKYYSSKVKSKVNTLSTFYFYGQLYNKVKGDLNNLKNKFILDYSDDQFNNIGWFSLMEYFFPRFVQSGYKIFMHKDFINRFLINPYIYKKYLSELARSETFIKFSQRIMNYKQQRGMRKFFVHLYRQRYKKIRHKQFHGLGSYYRVTYKIMSFLLNRPLRRYKFHFNSHRIKLFKIKLVKALYRLKRTKDCEPFLRTTNQNHCNVSNSTLIQWKQDLNITNKNDMVFKRNTRVFKDKNPILLGDRFQITNSNDVMYDLSIYERGNLFKLVHFYLNLFPLFDNNKLSLFKGFGKYSFFLDTIKYKFGYVLSKHLYYFKSQFNNAVPSRMKKNILPVRENNSTYYIHISNPYIHFNNKYIYMGEPFDLDKANLDEFYKFRFSLLRGKPLRRRKNNLLDFLNHLHRKTPHYMKIYHNRFHILRYIQFMKGIKSYLTFNFTHGFLLGKYSIIITSTNTSNDEYTLRAIRNKLHSNKVEELIVGNENFNSIQPID